MYLWYTSDLEFKFYVSFVLALHYDNDNNNDRFAHQIVHHPDSVPHYISAPFSTTGHGRTTRFSESNALKCDFKRMLLTVGGRSLSHTLPSVWNSLPQDLYNIQFIQVIPQNIVISRVLSRSLCVGCV